MFPRVFRKKTVYFFVIQTFRPPVPRKDKQKQEKQDPEPERSASVFRPNILYKKRKSDKGKAKNKLGAQTKQQEEVPRHKQKGKYHPSHSAPSAACLRSKLRTQCQNQMADQEQKDRHGKRLRHDRLRIHGSPCRTKAIEERNGKLEQERKQRHGIGSFFPSASPRNPVDGLYGEKGRIGIHQCLHHACIEEISRKPVL